QWHERPPHPVERRGGAETNEQEQEPNPAQPQDLPPALGHRDAQRGEDYHGQAEVLRMEFELVRAPVRVPRPAHEVLEEELRDMVPRDGERSRPLESVVALRPGRERDVLEERQDLNRRDPEADQHGREREAETQDALSSRAVTRLLDREVEREQSGDD